MREDSNSPDGSNLRDNSLENIETDKKTFKEEIKNLSRTDKKMIRGFMRGFGKIIILWLISKNRQHGYEIMTQLHNAASVDTKMPSASMIYPVLHGLERKGLIKGTWEHHGKRKVKYYEITSEGKESLERIKNLISKRQDPGETNLYQEFMEDMFSLKKVKN
ncbi:MAG: PadR family transcriptional regulator [Methanobacterium sp.]